VRKLVLLAVPVAALALAGPAAAVNPQIAGLQVALRAFGLYQGEIDGVAGGGTVAAVRAFQRRHGIPASGLADRRTRVALGPLGQPLFGRRTLGRGRFGLDVSVLQFLLQRRGFYRGALD
jgi:peptidoglycan hydrolase-like protein with peptidoglycan-binding domain